MKLKYDSILYIYFCIITIAEQKCRIRFNKDCSTVKARGLWPHDAWQRSKAPFELFGTVPCKRLEGAIGTPCDAGRSPRGFQSVKV